MKADDVICISLLTFDMRWTQHCPHTAALQTLLYTAHHTSMHFTDHTPSAIYVPGLRMKAGVVLPTPGVATTGSPSSPLLLLLLLERSTTTLLPLQHCEEGRGEGLPLLEAAAVERSSML